MFAVQSFAVCILSLAIQVVFIKSEANILKSSSVALEDAIITAVELDAEEDEQIAAEAAADRAKVLSTELSDANELMQEFWTLLTTGSELVVIEVENLLQEIDEGRGKFHKRRKMLKYLYPLLVGVVIAKTFVLPLILKALTALSTTSFVMSKIALVTSGLLALKWIVSGSAGGHEASNQRTKFDIIHLPVAKSYYGVAGAGGVSGGLHGTWPDDQNWSDSNVIGSYKYIPLGGDSSAFGVSQRHPMQHHFDSAAYSDGKPFL